MSTDLQAAFLGLGGMGAGMAHRLRDAGVRLVVQNRTAAKTIPLVDAGATAADTPAAAAADADVVFVSVADEAALDEVIFGPDGVAAGLRPGGYLVDTSTASPTYSIAAAEKLAAHGIRYVEARILGNPLHARSGELRVFAAGRDQDVEAVRPLLEIIGQEVRNLGPIGAASTFKLAFNVLLGAQLAAISEAVDMAERAGLSREVMLQTIGTSGLASPVLAFRCALALKGRFDPPAFRTRLMHKDLRLALSDARSPMPVIARAAEYFDAALERGLGELDAAIVLAAPEPATAAAPLAGAAR
ncbi:MAG: NAD(P)-dependent oxidoreductase [Catenulispora sp.]